MLDNQDNLLTYSEARDEFLSTLNRDEKTTVAYARAIELFLEFKPTPLHALTGQDARLLPRFIQWLRKYSVNHGWRAEHVGFASSSIRLYLQGIRKWFRWMAANDFFPPTFSYQTTLYNLNEALKDNSLRMSRKAPEPPEGMRQLLTYYDTTQPPEKIGDNPARLRRWRFEQLRNRVLLRVLAETAGRISEVLSLQVSDFPPVAFESDLWRVEVLIKGGHAHKLRFVESLPYIQRYIKERGAIDGPLFVSHSPTYEGRPMSRFSAWHVVDHASKALGLEHIHPHDFRHWCATELINMDIPLDVVQEILGHQYYSTTRDFYAHTRPERVDEYFKGARLLS